jgi:hypothetical protein
MNRIDKDLVVQISAPARPEDGHAIVHAIKQPAQIQEWD